MLIGLELGVTLCSYFIIYAVPRNHVDFLVSLAFLHIIAIVWSTVAVIKKKNHISYKVYFRCDKYATNQQGNLDYFFIQARNVIHIL